MRVIVFNIILFMIVATMTADIPEPGELAIVLNEDDFEDYLDLWLKRSYSNVSQTQPRSGCTLRVNGDLGQPQPVYIHKNNYLNPTGNTGQIHLSTGEEVTIACTGTGRTILHPNIATTASTGIATCVTNTLFTGNWLNGNGAFADLTCSSHSSHEAVSTSDRCYNNNLVIRPVFYELLTLLLWTCLPIIATAEVLRALCVGFTVNNVFYPLYWSCFDQDRLEVLYVWFEQNPPNAVHQTDVSRPSWSAGGFFPGVDINNRYTQVQQKLSIAAYVGNDLAEKYVTNTQFLARGHLAAKTDFIYATGQRATFYFINSAPQWQLFNSGNWNWLEQNLRARIGQAGYNTIIYTGTYGVTQLRNANNSFVDIYLHRDSNNNPQVPVPMYYYKVVYDATRRLGTAFVGINNPHYTLTEAQALQFCTDRCRNNNAFDWLGWRPDRVDLGYSFCCTIDDFRSFVPHLPAFTVDGLLS